MNDDWLEDTTDVLHCSMPPQVRAHIEALRDEVARLRAAEVPLSANVGFAYVTADNALWGDEQTGGAYVASADATVDAFVARGIPVALIPVTAWDRT